MNGAQWTIKALRKKGVEIIFGYPGGAIMPIYDALFDSEVEHLLCRHEQGAIMSAIGYARATGKIGVCFATSGPGATNLITGLADALLDSVPIVAITGQVGLEFIGTDAFQEIDVLGLSLACTKHSFLVHSLNMLPNIIDEAFFIASEGRPGPVLIDIPKDIQLSTGKLISNYYINKKDICSIESDIENARVLMLQACQPILYVGGGVGMAGAVTSLRTFISKTKIPTVVTLKGLGAPDYTEDCYLGMLGMHGNQAANLAVQKSDLLIAIGARFDDRVTGRLHTFAPQAKVIHVDIDPSEFSKLRLANVSLSGNLNDLLSALTQSLSIDPWRKKVKSLKLKYRWSYQSSDDKIYAPTLLRTISENAPYDTVVTTDVGQHQMWAAQHMQFSRPENFITSGGLGTMGFGTPAAIGAQIGRPNHMVICISGDGSFMMNVQELATIKRKNLPIKIVLLDNQRLGMVRQWQQLFFNKRYSETTLTDNPNFLVLAKAFDIHGICITYTSQILDAINMLFTHTGPFLLHALINEHENVWPLVPPGSSNDAMLEQ
ncbi:acetolactate synthase 2 catalytic subunit [Blochmannia endosymbiont of Camponotus modoc]|uniref:acetolactate synthase 2 catalytic subunit n=1 Tax=Blochmannia endosymbiont of Camponotus modoc TaxID=2945587 RepID=UPI002024A306|nr:acetolactate synthase 2 catalytic subunit [Blochmannia endosymbiont of Camponotus modoc]URJ29454.1 acetolactate synthase 2 catalytic subunit [Blochmannia endosymbiont of Camponotus modoc]